MKFNANFADLSVDVVHHMPQEDQVYIKETRIPKGTTLLMHTHTFSHKSVLCSGRVWLDAGERTMLIAPEVVTVKSGTPHAITAIDDSVWLCIHSTDETDPERIDHTITGH
jgi:quercetin dioxygenase-like cupin family protein